MAKYIPDFNTNILDTRKLAVVENYYYKNKMFETSATLKVSFEGNETPSLRNGCFK